MKHSLHTVLTLLFVCASAWGENVPWQNPQINEINREPVCLSSVWCYTPFYKNLSGIPHCF